MLCVRAMVRIKRLKYTAEPLNVEDAMRDPYRVKILRKVFEFQLFRLNNTNLSLFKNIGHRWLRISCVWSLGKKRRRTESRSIVRKHTKNRIALFICKQLKLLELNYYECFKAIKKSIN